LEPSNRQQQNVMRFRTCAEQSEELSDHLQNQPNKKEKGNKHQAKHKPGCPHSLKVLDERQHDDPARGDFSHHVAEEEFLIEGIGK
jgi:hypothetical protein